jgi:hypothetical protein
MKVCPSTGTALDATDGMKIFFIMPSPIVEAHFVHRASFECRLVVLVECGLVLKRSNAEATVDAVVLHFDSTSGGIVYYNMAAGALVIGWDDGGSIVVYKLVIGIICCPASQSTFAKAREPG